jgi:hypothetical protein
VTHVTAERVKRPPSVAELPIRTLTPERRYVMSLLPIFSTTAIVIGLAAALPQLAAMLNARSAAGQSALGWSLGAFVNCLMAYVNYVGYGAKVLAAG